MKQSTWFAIAYNAESKRYNKRGKKQRENRIRVVNSVRFFMRTDSDLKDGHASILRNNHAFL